LLSFLQIQFEAINGNYVLSTDKNKLVLAAIHHYLREESYWAANIPLATVEQKIANSICIGLYERKNHQDEQIGFARLITDCTTFAYLADVYVLSTHRGKGLSKWMLTNLQALPELQGLRRWLLVTKDAHGLYEKLGWTAIDEPQKMMQRHFKSVYQSATNNTSN
jgi:GNAT superfamily N-acetyltransferase